MRCYFVGDIAGPDDSAEDIVVHTIFSYLWWLNDLLSANIAEYGTSINTFSVRL